jgi:hypothetical protein
MFNEALQRISRRLDRHSIASVVQNAGAIAFDLTERFIGSGGAP